MSKLNHLAVNGGKPIRHRPWPKRNIFGLRERIAAFNTLKNDLGYNGVIEEEYCNKFSEYMGGGYTDAVNSGTSAIYVALKALDIEPFSEIIVSAITDPGGCMPIPLINCIPIPADSLSGHYNTEFEYIEKNISSLTSAIIIPHISGIPVDIGPIVKTARERNIPLIEDCSQAHGAHYKGQKVGTFGDVSVFSTMSSKHHATGCQGGVIFTKSENLYWKIRSASDRGKSFFDPQVNDNLTASLNFNSNDLSASIGIEQLQKLDKNIELRRRFTKSLYDRTQTLKSVSIQFGSSKVESVFWFLTFKFHSNNVKVSKKDFVEAVFHEGIPLSDHYVSPFTEQYWFKHKKVFGTSGLPWSSVEYKGDANREYSLPNCKKNEKCLFLLPIHERCGEKEAKDVFDALNKVENCYLY